MVIYMRPPTPSDVASAIYQIALGQGISCPSEIEDQAGQLLARFALEHPEHPIAWFFETASDGEIEAFFAALGQRLSAERTTTPILAGLLAVSAIVSVDLRVWMN